MAVVRQVLGFGKSHDPGGAVSAWVPDSFRDVMSDVLTLSLRTKPNKVRWKKYQPFMIGW
jgi:hypothetical protein